MNKKTTFLFLRKLVFLFACFRVLKHLLIATVFAITILFLIRSSIFQAMAQESTSSAKTPPAPTPTATLPTQTPIPNPTQPPTLTPVALTSPAFSPTPTPLTIPSSTPTPTTVLDLLPTIIPMSDEQTEATATPTLSASPTFMPSAALKPPMTIHPFTKRYFKAAETIKIRLLNALDQDFTVSLTHVSGEKINVILEKQIVGDQVILLLHPPQNFKPGKYTFKVTNAAGQTAEQDFTWGVLAINTNKSIYTLTDANGKAKENETVKLAMAVLDEKGNMVCDAKVKLKIQNSNLKTTSQNSKPVETILSTEDGTITVNPECRKHEFTTKPDYEATYQVRDVGTYEMTLTAETKNGIYTITDSFEVREKVPFDIERETATRIYPPETYPMTITITANQDFNGTIEEIVPANLIISQPMAKDHDLSILPYNQIETISKPAVKGEVLGTSISHLHRPFPGEFPITLGFGEQYDDRTLVEKILKWGLKGHDGVDFGIPEGSSVLAADEGKVLLAGKGPYGTTVIIKHAWGESYYGHLSKVIVQKNQHVSAGEQIALSGNTGISTGSHLHFSIKPKNAEIDNGFFGKTDPLPYLGYGNSKVLSATTTAKHVKRISWNVSVKKGDQITLGYQFRTSLVSPQFYLLGPLKLHEKTRKGTLNNAKISVGSRRTATSNTSLEATTSAEPSIATSSSSMTTTSASQPQSLSVDSLSPSRGLVFQELRSWQLAADSPGPGIEQQINIIDREVSALGGTGSTGLIHINTSDFTGATYYFEVIAKVDSGSGTVTLTYGAGDGATPTGGSTTQITGITATSYTRYRSGSFALSTGNAYLSAMTGTGIKLNAARIIIVQTSASSITDTQTQVEIGNNESSTNTSLTALSGAKYFSFDASKYDGTITAYLEVTMASSTYTTNTSITGGDPSSGNCVDTNTPSIGTVTWTNPGNAAVSDSNNASASVDGTITHWIKCTGFDFTSLPTGATINGIVVSIQRSASGTTKPVTDAGARVVKAGTIGTTDRSTTTSWPVTEAYEDHGGSGDLWGDTWSDTDIDNSGFGAAIAATKANSAGQPVTAYVNHIKITVYYSTSGTATATADLYNLTDSASVGNSTVSVASTTYNRLRSSALTTNWDTSNADEYAVRAKTSNSTGQAHIVNAKIILDQTNSSGITKLETYHSYFNTFHDTLTYDVGSFSTTSQGQLSEISYGLTSVTVAIGGTNYVYVLGGYSDHYQSTVYKATIDSSGNIGSFSTSNQGQLPLGRYSPTSVTTSIGGTYYVYVLGGYKSAPGGYLSTVYKATIDSSGDIGSFDTSSQGQLPKTLYYHTSVTASIGGTNYVYVLGGYDGSTNYSTVYKATIDSSGDIGSFDTTSQGQLPQILSNLTSNTASIGGSNYVYVLGGSSFSTVYKATIDSSGDIGSFDTTSQGQLPQILYEHTSVITSIGGTNYVYVLGGYNTASQSTVYKATIDSSGDIGSFDTTSQGQLPQKIYYHTSATASIGGSNYVYVLGGVTTGIDYQSTVYKATLGVRDLTSGPSGDIGSFNTTSQGQLPQILRLFASVTASNGGSDYVYALGGWNNTSAQSTVYKATIDSSGNISSFSTTNQGQLPQIIAYHTSITTSIGGTNYVYVLGGYDSGTIYYSTVYKATIDSSGDIGSFNTTSQGQLPQKIYYHTSATASIGGTNYVYVLGGFYSGVKSTVYKATIDSSGNIGSFSTSNQGQLPQGLSQLTSVTASISGTNYIYVLGGYGPTRQSTVYKATIDSSGNIGSFSTSNQGQLPQILTKHTSVTASIGGTNYVYVLGGDIDTLIFQSTVYKATIDSSGNIGSFSTSSQEQLPQILYEHTTVITSIGGTNYVYVLGGYNPNNSPSTQSTVYKAQISSNSLSFNYDNRYESSDWTGGTFTYYHEGTIKGVTSSTGQAYLDPGNLGQITTTPTSGTSTGDIGSFTTTSQGQLPQLMSDHGSVTASIGGTNYVYVLGGYNTTYRSTVYKATIDSSGNIGSFSTTNQGQLGDALELHSTATIIIGGTNYVYVLGGASNNFNATTVYKATIDSSGNMGSFSTTNQGQLLKNSYKHTSVTASIGGSNYVYVLGGEWDIIAGPYSTVYKATIDSSGNIGSFSTSSQSQLPQKLKKHTSVTASIGGSNYVYVLGGHNGSASQSTVYKATIDSSGNIGSFSTSSQGQLPQKLRGLTSVTSSIGGTNYVYVLGGYNTATRSTVYKATIDSSGNIGSFSTSSQGQLPQILDSHSSVTTSIGGTNYIYVLGGYGDGSAYQSTVYKAQIEGGGPAPFSLTRSSSITPVDNTDYDAVIQTAGLSTSWLVINVTGLEAVSGPTLDQLLRHGEWFNSSGVEQPFTF